MLRKFSQAQSKVRKESHDNNFPKKSLPESVEKNLNSAEEEKISPAEQQIEIATPFPILIETVIPRATQLETQLLQQQTASIDALQKQLEELKVKSSGDLAEMKPTLPDEEVQGLQDKQAKEALLTQLMQRQERLQEFEKHQVAVNQQARDTLEALRVSKLNLERQIDILRLQAGTDKTAIIKLAALEARLQPLMDQFDEHQSMLEEQDYINNSAYLKNFYCYLQAKLNQAFIAYLSISSGLIDKSNNSILSLLGSVTSGIPNSIISGISAAYTRDETKKIIQTTDAFIVSIRAADELSESIAQQLALRYEDQIKKITLPGPESIWQTLTLSAGSRGGVQTLAECAAGRILNTLSWLLNTNKDIDTEKEHVGNKFTDEEIFQRSGIKVLGIRKFNHPLSRNRILIHICYQ